MISSLSFDKFIIYLRKYNCNRQNIQTYGSIIVYFVYTSVRKAPEEPGQRFHRLYNVKASGFTVTEDRIDIFHHGTFCTAGKTGKVCGSRFFVVVI